MSVISSQYSTDSSDSNVVAEYSAFGISLQNCEANLRERVCLRGLRKDIGVLQARARARAREQQFKW